METIKVWADSEKTIPVPLADPEIKALTSKLLAAQEIQSTAVALAIKTAQASAASVQRAIEFAKEHNVEDETDPQVIGLIAELRAAREQSAAATQIAVSKMQIVIGIFKELEQASRTKNLEFN